jgi:predicted transcriptional regulator
MASILSDIDACIIRINRRKAILFIFFRGANPLDCRTFQRDPLRELLARDLAADQPGKLDQSVVDGFLAHMRRPPVVDRHQLDPDLSLRLRHYQARCPNICRKHRDLIIEAREDLGAGYAAIGGYRIESDSSPRCQFGNEAECCCESYVFSSRSRNSVNEPGFSHPAFDIQPKSPQGPALLFPGCNVPEDQSSQENKEDTAMSEAAKPDLTTLTVQLLSAYVGNNAVPSSELAELIRTTKAALAEDEQPASAPEPEHIPAVSVKASLASRDHIISLIDGKPYKSLKRHLSTRGLTPDEYRERYKLPASYPMVAPGYSEQRRQVAKQLGLGRKKTEPETVSEAPQTEAAPAPAAKRSTRAKGTNSPVTQAKPASKRTRTAKPRETQPAE